MEYVILVDENDQPVGAMEKLEAHQKGILHRAFSILLFNSQGEILLQKRAMSKYHSQGLWTNTCCSHPAPGESLDNATFRKLKQEMGIETVTTFAYQFIYRTELPEGLVEHELDHVFIGQFDGIPKPNPEEVEEWKYASLEDIRQSIKMSPELYTEWFKLIISNPTLDVLINRYAYT